MQDKAKIAKIPPEVKILVQDSQCTADPPDAEADPQEMVTWKCEFPFAIYFGDQKSPVKWMASPKAKFNGVDFEIADNVTYDPAYGGTRCFKYYVAVWNPKIERVIIIDPGLVVPRGGG